MLDNRIEITKDVLIADAVKYPLNYDKFQVSNHVYSIKSSFGKLHVCRIGKMIFFPLKEIKIEGCEKNIKSIAFDINKEEYIKLIMQRK